MKLLIIDTSTSVFSMAVTRGNEVLATETGSGGFATAGRLDPAVTRVMERSSLTLAQLDGFAVTVGPGAFTGLRVGISLVKGLAYATAKPVVCLSSLELLAMNAFDSSLPVCPMFDARKAEIYGALFQMDGEDRILIPEMAADPVAFLQMITGPALFIGDGALRYQPLIIEQLGRSATFCDPQLNNPIASAGVSLALREFSAGNSMSATDILPCYLRLSEAELNKH